MLDSDMLKDDMFKTLGMKVWTLGLQETEE